MFQKGYKLFSIVTNNDLGNIFIPMKYKPVCFIGWNVHIKNYLIENFYLINSISNYKHRKNKNNILSYNKILRHSILKRRS